MSSRRSSDLSSGGRARAGAVCALIALTLVAAGCAGSKDKAAPPQASPAQTSGSATGGTTGGTETEGTATSGTETDGTTGPTSVWHQDAVAYRGHNGSTHTLACTPHGTAFAVWGAGTYTDDSSICTAAVQSGLITLADGGTVTYQIGPGLASYPSGRAHGISSSSYASWAGSFSFPAATGKISIAAGPESWSESATDYRGDNNRQITVTCSKNGSLGSVWGRGPFTDDSSICTAAVFAGLITRAAGGTVLVQIAPGAKSYQGATAHGVTTADYGSWSGSYTFPGGQPSS
jgi:hypothetical protein